MPHIVNQLRRRNRRARRPIGTLSLLAPTRAEGKPGRAARLGAGLLRRPAGPTGMRIGLTISSRGRYVRMYLRYLDPERSTTEHLHKHRSHRKMPRNLTVDTEPARAEGQQSLVP